MSSGLAALLEAEGQPERERIRILSLGTRARSPSSAGTMRAKSPPVFTTAALTSRELLPNVSSDMHRNCRVEVHVAGKYM
eukprot:1139698-Pelagomonas_calceolata.AAC.4